MERIVDASEIVWPASFLDLDEEQIASLQLMDDVTLNRYSNQAKFARHNKAIVRLYGEIHRRHPDNLSSLVRKAISEKILGSYDDALVSFERLLNLQAGINQDSRETRRHIEELRALKQGITVGATQRSARRAVQAAIEAAVAVSKPTEEPVSEPAPEPEFVPKLPGMHEFFGRLEASCAVWPEAKELLGEGWFVIPEEESGQVKAEFEKYKERLRANLPSSKIRSTEAKRFWASMESAARFIAAGNVRLESIRNLMAEYSTVRELFS